ncbi:hypothetical protein [Endozoicomonas sp. Mp262]
MKYILTLILSLTLVGCASTKINYAQEASKLSLAMTKQDVIQLLGQPKRTSVRMHQGKKVEELSYWSEVVYGCTPVDNEMLANDRVTITLTDGVVTEWGDKLDHNRMIEKAYEQQQKLLQDIQPAEVNVK